MRIVCISDTHLQHDFEIPEGDVLVHAGDLTFQGNRNEIFRAAKWLSEAPVDHKVVIAGNHDWLFQKNPDEARKILSDAGLIYLQDEAHVIDGIKFWGSPWQPEFCNWAFNLDRFSGDLAGKWELIPEDTDVLITHGPPMRILDETAAYENVFCGEVRYSPPRSVGCYDLLERIKKVKPQLHVFGHIHNSYGQKEVNGTIFVNASTCDEHYKPTNLPIVVDLEKKEAAL